MYRIAGHIFLAGAKHWGGADRGVIPGRWMEKAGTLDFEYPLPIPGIRLGLLVGRWYVAQDSSTFRRGELFVRRLAMQYRTRPSAR